MTDNQISTDKSVWNSKTTTIDSFPKPYLFKE